MAIEGESVAGWLLAAISEDKAFAEKYQIEAELGYGAAGVVIGARHRVLDQRVAIKFLLSGNEDAEAIARFVREARAASRIRNQHVVRVVDASALGSGIPYLVMEYLDGVDLERMLHESPQRQLPITDAIDFILQTGEALAECHGAGIVHRDLKPSNLFCVHGADGLPMIKVLDFGIAKLGKTTIEAELPEGAVGGGRQRRVFGSPAYMSPEQFESSTQADLRSDIWALGVILYEFVTGELPFQETSIYRIRKRVAEDAPRPIRELRRDSPAELWPVILKCLEKDPAQRYSNLAELAKALRPFASPRAKNSVARIVRTIEAPGSDTGALSLDSRSSRRPSMSPLVRSLVIVKPRGPLFGALAVIFGLAATLLGLYTRRVTSPEPGAPSSSLVSLTSKNVGTATLLSPSQISPVPRSESELPKPATVASPSASTVNSNSPNPRIGTSKHWLPKSSASTATSAIAKVEANQSTSGDTSSNAAPASSTPNDGTSSTKPFATEKATTVTPTPSSTQSAQPNWSVPIIETRKRSH